TVATPIFTPPIAGSYRVQLTVTDSLGQIGVGSDTIGAIATDNNDVVITGDATLDRLVGPLTRSGTSPWPYYDIAEKGLADMIATAALSNPPSLGVKIRGTVEVTNRPVFLIGTDTHFTEDLAAGMSIVIAWDTIDGPGTGRLTTAIQSIQDDTHATTN